MYRVATCEGPPLINLVVKPDGPWLGFLQGAAVTFVSVGTPVIVVTLMRSWSAKGPGSLFVSVPLALGAALLGGSGLALWRLAQAWAYRRFTEGPP